MQCVRCRRKPFPIYIYVSGTDVGLKQPTPMFLNWVKVAIKEDEQSIGTCCEVSLNISKNSLQLCGRFSVRQANATKQNSLYPTEPIFSAAANSSSLRAHVNRLERFYCLTLLRVKGGSHLPYEGRLLQGNVFLFESRCL